MKAKKVGQIFISGGLAALNEAAAAAYKEGKRAAKAGDDDAEQWMQIGDFIAGFAGSWPR